jgi:DNA-binding NarL/FixJ family response regulator
MSNPRERILVLTVNANNMGSSLLADALKRSNNHFDVVALVGSSYHVTSELAKHRPRIALISAELQDGPQAGFNVLEKFRVICPMIPAVMLLDSSRPEPVVDAFRKGARGVFCTASSFEALPKCIQCVCQGQIWANNNQLEYIMNTLSHGMSSRPLRTPEGNPLLTPREETLVSLVTEGMRNRDIAISMRVTEHTVRNYLSRIFEKIGVSNRVELILYVLAQQHPRPVQITGATNESSNDRVVSAMSPKPSRTCDVVDTAVHHPRLAEGGRKRTIRHRNL